MFFYQYFQYIHFFSFLLHLDALKTILETTNANEQRMIYLVRKIKFMLQDNFFVNDNNNNNT